MSKTSRTTVRIFLSYSTSDKKFVGELKNALELVGPNVFLAHQDISPSLEWRNIILSNLKSCDVFVPIITTKFHLSAWTDQESGIALANNKLILPAAIDKLPYGFLDGFQAVKGKRVYIQKLAFDLIAGLSKQKSLRNRLRETIIPSLKKSRHFDDSGYICELLFKLSPFSRRQMDLILRGAILNYQVYKARTAVEPIGKIIRANHGRTDSVFLKRFQELTS
jgi:hypothetical protein